MAASTVDVDGFWEYGYTIVRGVYTPQEIARFREAAFAAKGSGGDLLSKPVLREVITDGRLVDIAGKVLGRNDIVYYGDSSFTIIPGTPGYHKDNADRTDQKAPDWTGDPYTQLRFGIYLQDHTKHSGGLNLREKSHNTVSLKEGKTVYLKTRVGDVGVWSLRTSHSGGGTLLRFPGWVYPEPGDTKYPSFLVAPAHKERVSLFLALGADDKHADRYVEYLKTRKYMADSYRKAFYDEDTLKEAEKIGLRVRDVRTEIEGDENAGKNEKWAPIPY
jgi:hypothetical protein